MENLETNKIKHFNPIPQVLVLVLSIFFGLFIFEAGNSSTKGPLILSSIGALYVVISTIIKIRKSDDIGEWVVAFFLTMFSIIILFVASSIIFNF
ncbi:MAG: hypothetical protein WC241_02820 [Candidatus Paceibacterota bacterium]|jgi:hypothetical protein